MASASAFRSTGAGFGWHAARMIAAASERRATFFILQMILGFTMGNKVSQKFSAFCDEFQIITGAIEI